ncbi:MAG: BspA family leucine-rich repeat surface protein, partial [Lactobacillus sp.]|nr:BspA family leucine-rich repeat surface protein [Lactobacillus sp.]
AVHTSAQSTQGLADMFSGCTNLTSLDISNFDISNTDSLKGMFQGCAKLSHLDLDNFDTSNITDMREMFSGCSSLTDIDLGGFDTANVIRMGSLFKDCEKLTNVDLSSFNTAKVTDMSSMFYGCKALVNLEIANFDTAEVTDMNRMFYDCNSLQSLDLSSFDTGKVTTMEWMFVRCSSLTSLDLSSFNFGSVTNAYGMFTTCTRLETIYTPYNVKVNAKIKLPVEVIGDVWYSKEGESSTEMTTLPEGLDHSILITKNKIPEAKAHITARKNKTAFICGETLVLDDLTVVYYGTDGTVRRLTQEQYTTNAAQIDMNEQGEKKLIVIYQADGIDLTAEITLKVAYGLSADSAIITLPADTAYNYTYDGKAKQPKPSVSYRKKAADGTETSVALTEGTDYTVSY